MDEIEDQNELISIYEKLKLLIENVKNYHPEKGQELDDIMDNIKLEESMEVNWDKLVSADENVHKIILSVHNQINTTKIRGIAASYERRSDLEILKNSIENSIGIVKSFHKEKA